MVIPVPEDDREVQRPRVSVSAAILAEIRNVVRVGAVRCLIRRASRRPPPCGSGGAGIEDSNRRTRFISGEIENERSMRTARVYDQYATGKGNAHINFVRTNLCESYQSLRRSSRANASVGANIQIINCAGAGRQRYGHTTQNDCSKSDAATHLGFFQFR